MHILIVALHRPSKPTGVCRHAANLAQCLADTDEVTRVTLIVGAWQKEYFETFVDSPKIDLMGIDIKNSSLVRNLWFLFGLPNLVNRLHPDLVYMAFPFPFLRPLFSPPIVSTIHDLYPYERPEVFGYPNAIFNRLFLQQCIASSDGLVCVSQATCNSLKNYFHKIDLYKSVTVIYNYVNFDGLTPQLPRKINIKEGEPFLLCVAQHRKNKNIDILIKAFYELQQNEPIQNLTKLVIIGSTGPETTNLYNQISTCNLQDRVLLIDSIQDSELCWFYENCKVFIASSSQEGFCLPLAEAMHFSCNVVCSDVPIFKEIGATSCTYFEITGNIVQNLVQAISCALEKPLNRNNKDYRFSQINTAENYLKFFSLMINKKHLTLGLARSPKSSF